MVKLTVYWATRNAEANAKIRQRFGIPAGMTVNGETVAEIREEDMPLLEETARRGFIQIRYKPDTRKGNVLDRFKTYNVVPLAGGSRR